MKTNTRKSTLLHLLTAAAVLALAAPLPAHAANTILHSFTGGTDGDFPVGSLTLSGAKLYGLTLQGGSSSAGTLFSLNTDGTGYGLLESFTGAPDGNAPALGDVTLSGDASTLYGMTQLGGTFDLGVVFSHPTPEPASTALLLGSAALFALRRRRSA